MYCDSNPLSRTDPAGKFVDVIADVLFTGLDLADFVNKPSWGGLGMILVDIGFVAVPLIPNFVSGGTRVAKWISKGERAVEEGVYVVTTKSGRKYVGQSKRISKRLGEHANSGKFADDPIESVERIHVPGGRTAREIAEQRLIDAAGGVRDPGEISARNPIGSKRRYLLE